MDIQHFFTNIKESIYNLNQVVDNVRNIRSPASLAAKPITPTDKGQHHQRQSSNMSIEDDINCNSGPAQRYKCFKCYGVTHLNSHHSMPLCDQCSGSEQISDTHPLAALFDKVLKAKLPALIEKSQQVSSQTNIVSFVTCHSCSQKIQSDNALFCDTCPDDAICQSCYNNKLYIHTPSHNFVRKAIKNHLVKLNQKMPTMKKISEQFESQEACGGSQLLCSNCGHEIEDCYECCMDCELQGKYFFLCSNCSEQNNYIHDRRHNFTLQMVNKQSKLPLYSNRGSKNINTTSLDFDNDTTWVNNGIGQAKSIVFITQEPDNDSQEQEIRLSPFRNNNKMESSQTQNCVFDESRPFNPESVETSPQSAKNKESKLQQSVMKSLRNQSIIKINMDESQQIPIDQIVLKQFEVTTSQTAIEEESPHLQLHPPHEDIYFNDYECDICGVSPIKNRRYHCKECEDYDICSDCFLQRMDEHCHQNFEEIDALKQKEQRRSKIVQQYQRSSLGNLSIHRKTLKQ